MKKLNSIQSINNIQNDLNSVSDYLKDLYKKQGGNLSLVGAKSLIKDSNSLDTIKSTLIKISKLSKKMSK